MMAPILARLGDIGVLKSIGNSFGLKAMTVTLNFGLIALLARSLSPEAFGSFSMLFSAAGLLAIVGIFGQQVLLLRQWSEFTSANDLPRLKGAFRFTAQTTLWGLGLTTPIFLGAASTMVGLNAAAAATAYLLIVALTTVSAHIVRVAVGIFSADGLVVLGLLSPPITALAVGADLGEADIFWLMAGGGLLVFLAHALLLWRVIAKRFPLYAGSPSNADRPVLFRASIRLWGSQVLEVCNQYLDVLVVGMLLSPASAGAYFVITRLANMFATLSAAIYVSTTRHLPDLYFGKKQTELEKLLDVTALATAAATLGGLLVIVIGGDRLLMLFGVDDPALRLDLWILSLATAFVAATGPAAVFLNIAGHEGSYLRTLAIGVFVRMGGFLALVPTMGIRGAVLASFVSMAWLALRSRQQALKLTGQDTSIFRFGTRMRPAAGGQ